MIKIWHKTLATVFLYGVLLLPHLANAESFKQFVEGRILVLINPLVVLVTGLALLFFLWGIAQLIFSAGDEAKLAEGRQRMLWGKIRTL